MGTVLASSACFFSYGSWLQTTPKWNHSELMEFSAFWNRHLWLNASKTGCPCSNHGGHHIWGCVKHDVTHLLRMSEPNYFGVKTKAIQNMLHIVSWILTQVAIWWLDTPPHGSSLLHTSWSRKIIAQSRTRHACHHQRPPRWCGSPHHGQPSSEAWHSLVSPA